MTIEIAGVCALIGTIVGLFLFSIFGNTSTKFNDPEEDKPTKEEELKPVEITMPASIINTAKKYPDPYDVDISIHKMMMVHQMRQMKMESLARFTVLNAHLAEVLQHIYDPEMEVVQEGIISTISAHKDRYPADLYRHLALEGIPYDIRYRYSLAKPQHCRVDQDGKVLHWSKDDNDYIVNILDYEQLINVPDVLQKLLKQQLRMVKPEPLSIEMVQYRKLYQTIKLLKQE